MKGQRIAWSAQELAWIEARRDRPRADLHAAFVETFARPDVPLSAVISLCKRKGWSNGRITRFAPGHDRSPNKGQKGQCAPGSEKGWFKAGERTGRAHALHQPIGTERLRDGYLVRKINEDRPFYLRWRAVHLLNWEAIHGPLPQGHCLKCLDGNPLNTDPANWALISRALQTRLNGINGRGFDQAPPEVKPTILVTARLEQKLADLRKGATG